MEIDTQIGSCKINYDDILKLSIGLNSAIEQGSFNILMSEKILSSTLSLFQISFDLLIMLHNNKSHIFNLVMGEGHSYLINCLVKRKQSFMTFHSILGISIFHIDNETLPTL